MAGCAGLVLTGGGARGAYQAGAVLAISEIVPGHALPFPILAGSSAGSINVAYLGSRADDFPQAARDLADLWTSLEPSKVFKTDAVTLAKTGVGWIEDLGFGGWIGTGRGKSLLDTAPLRELLHAQFDAAALAHHVRAGRVRGAGITATNYESGLAVTFFEGDASIAPWNRVTRVGLRAAIDFRHVLASSAIPVFFPAVEIDGDWYADGSVRLSTPLSPAIHMGAERIVAIAVRHEAERAAGSAPREPVGYPTLADTGGVLLNALLLDALESDVERTRRINLTLSLLAPEVRASQRTQLRNVDVLALRPSVDLGSLVMKTLERFPLVVRHLFRGLGASDVAGWDLLSYLAFDVAYTTRLLELGYEDTMVRADEIRAFLA